MWILFLVLIVLGVFFFIAISNGVKSSGTPNNSFKQKLFLTNNEMEFLGRLERAVPEFRFHAQVAMGALVDPKINRKDNGKLYMSLRGKFSQKIVDFVAQEKETGKIIAIIELDDITHNTQKDDSRDSITKQAGYKTIRWQSKKKPTIEEIRMELMKVKNSENTVKLFKR